MTNDPFRIRLGPSGPEMPAGTPGYVLTVQADGVSVKPEPAPGGSGSVTPLTASLVGDENGTATTPTGAFSGDKAFNGAGALPDLVAAMGATGGGGIWLAPGAYSGNGSALSIQELLLTIRGMGTTGLQPAGVRIFGNITMNASDSAAALTMEDLVCDADISDGGTGGEVHLARVGASGTISITGPFSAQDSACGPLQANAVEAQRTDFSGAQSYLGTSTIDGCTYAGALTMTGGGQLLNTNINSGALVVPAPLVMVNCEFNSAGDTAALVATTAGSRLLGNVFLGSVQFGTGSFDVERCTFAKAIAQTAGGTVRMWNCVYDTGGGAFALASDNLFLDGASELNALLAGVDISASIIRALDSGQGGDAVVLNGDATKNFTAQTRVHVPKNLGADITLTLALTGALAGAMQCFTVDQYATGHTVTVKFGLTTLVVIPAVAAGTALRVVLQVDPTDAAIGLVGSRKLAG